MYCQILGLSVGKFIIQGQTNVVKFVVYKIQVTNATNFQVAGIFNWQESTNVCRECRLVFPDINKN